MHIRLFSLAPFFSGRYRLTLLTLAYLNIVVYTLRAQGTLGMDSAFKLRTLSVQWLPDSDGHKQVIIYADKQITHICNVEADSCRIMKTFAFKTEDAVFSPSGDKLFLLHARTFRGAWVTVYDTRTWTPLNTKRVSSKANAISVNANDSLVGISTGPLIRVLRREDLRTVRVFWETRKQRQLVFNPVLPFQAASVTPGNIIQVRDLAQDVILAEIKAHDSPIVWLAYQPGGEWLASLDNNGNLFACSVSQQKCLLQGRGVHGVPVFDTRGYLHRRAGNREVTTDVAHAGVQGDTVQQQAYFIKNKQKAFQVSPQPVITYMPETGMLLGASANLLFYPKSRMPYPPYYWPSTVIPSVAYGLDGGQWRTGVALDVYGKTGCHVVGTLSYNIRERSYFFGIGGRADKDVRQFYFFNAFSFSGSVLRNITEKLKAGVGYNVRHYTAPHFENETVIYPGAGGGWLTGVGPAVQLDNRDDMIYPTRGSLLDVSLYGYRSELKSDFYYNEMIVNYRKYFLAGFVKKGSVLAMQGFVHATWGGNVPFYQLPYLSADRVLRGMWRNLYIDRQIAFAQAEFRSLFGAGDTRFGYVLFAGAGDGAGNFLKDYNGRNIKIVYGAGYRQQLVPKLRLDLRIDFAATNKGNFGIYGGAGVAF